MIMASVCLLLRFQLYALTRVGNAIDTWISLSGSPNPHLASDMSSVLFDDHL